MFNILETVQRAGILYQSPDGFIPNPGNKEAVDFLKRVEYFDSNETRTEEVNTQRLRCDLLAFASRFSSLFTIDRPVADAPKLADGTILPAEVDDSLRRIEPISSGGRGLIFQNAFEGCVFEMVERLASLTRRHEMNRPVSARNICDGAKLFLTSEVVFNGRNFRGMASASSRRDAMRAALLECAERFALAKWWNDQWSPPELFELSNDIMPDVFELSPDRKRWLLDLCDVTGIPVVAACSSNERNEAIVTGAGAGATLQEAGHKAILELYQMEYAAAISAWKCANLPDCDVKPVDRLWQSRLDSHSILSFPAFSPTKRASRKKRPALSEEEISAVLTKKIGHGYVIDRSSAIDRIKTIQVLFPRTALNALNKGPDPKPI